MRPPRPESAVSAFFSVMDIGRPQRVAWPPYLGNVPPQLVACATPVVCVLIQELPPWGCRFSVNEQADFTHIY